MNPFQQHAGLMEQYENLTGAGTPLATLTFTSLNPQITVPVTHTKIDASFILSAGRSYDTTIERCEFRACLIPANQQCYIEKKLACSLVIKPGLPPIMMQLWDGGLVEGAEIYRYMLVVENYKA